MTIVISRPVVVSCALPGATAQGTEVMDRGRVPADLVAGSKEATGH